MKVVINGDYGGFGLSQEALKRLVEKGWKVVDTYPTPKELDEDIRVVVVRNGQYFLGAPTYHRKLRTHPDLIAVVEELGNRANDFGSSLKIVEIPDDVEWIIEERDGLEWIAEKHRTWG